MSNLETEAGSFFVERGGILQGAVVSEGQTPGVLREKLISRSGVSKEPNKGVLAVLSDSAFTPTVGVNYRLGLLLGEKFPDASRVSGEIRKVGGDRRMLPLPLEASALGLLKISMKEMQKLELWFVIAMHEPVLDPYEYSHLLSLGGMGICTVPGIKTLGHYKQTGFLFLVE
ncbi:MAG: hypothetical protein PHV42_01905 [Candidatus Pacebacteria bacterium]|nr:hypothetical protein [Candidatus Paceibacterota bacterium]